MPAPTEEDSPGGEAGVTMSGDEVGAEVGTKVGSAEVGILLVEEKEVETNCPNFRLMVLISSTRLLTARSLPKSRVYRLDSGKTARVWWERATRRARQVTV